MPSLINPMVAALRRWAARQAVRSTAPNIYLSSALGCSNYWIGLQVEQRPDFGWMDPTAPPLDASAYQHWGQVNGVTVEPDNREMPPEDCAVANYTEVYGGAWGWADVNCGRHFISMCKITSGWRCRAQAGSCPSTLRRAAPGNSPPQRSGSACGCWKKRCHHVSVAATWAHVRRDWRLPS
jgi:hypothetical protein